MGDARRNPRSAQYRPAPGSMPDNVLGAEIHPVARPSDEWLKSHPTVPGQAAPVPGDDDLVVEYQLFATWVCPSSLVDQSKWPAARVPILNLCVVPLVDLRERMKQVGMVFPEVKKAEAVHADA